MSESEGRKPSVTEKPELEEVPPREKHTPNTALYGENRPIGKLAALTKKRNRIEELLPNPIENLVRIKAYFNEYLVKLEELHRVCDSQSLQTWLSPNLDSINRFRAKVENLIHPMTAAAEPNPSVSSRSSCASVVSAKVRLAEKKAMLASQKLAAVNAKEIAVAEHELKLNYLELEKKKGMIEARKLEAKHKEAEVETKVLENELNKMETSEACSVNSELDLRSSASNIADSNLIGKILQKQNEISMNMILSQDRTLLPKKDIQVFDGTDVTKFSSFILNFERAIENKCENDSDRIIYLEQYTSGKAKKLVQSCAHFDAGIGYIKAKKLLRHEYGNEFIVADSYIKRLQNWPSIKNEDSSALEELSIYLLNCSHYMENMSQCNQLQSPQELMNIVKKLPYRMRERWRRKTHSIQRRSDQVTFGALVDFVREESAILRQPLFGVIGDDFHMKDRGSLDKAKKSFSTAVTDSGSECADLPEESEQNSLGCEFCKKTNHKLEDCFFFRKQSPDKRTRFVKDNGLCFGCLSRQHFSRSCPDRKKCSMCGKGHPTVLHDQSRETVVDRTESILTHSTYSSELAGDGKKTTICPIISAKIKIAGVEKEKIINVALDTCSTDCWMNEDLLRVLGVSGTNKTINLTTMSEKCNEVQLKVVNNVILTDLCDNNTVTIPVVYTKPSHKWPFSKDDLPRLKDLDCFPHLRSVPFNFVDANIDLLVGMNVPSLLKCRQIVERADDEPYASLHLLGWTVNGPINRRNRNHVNLRMKTANLEEIEENIQSYFRQDYMDDSDEVGLSREEIKWYEIMNSSIKRLETGHYEIDLPFREEDPKLPNNKSQVLSRFKALQGRLRRDDTLSEEYHVFMDTMISRKFMVKIPEHELQAEHGKVWYLTHHAIYHKQKHKLRIVFDCSLKYSNTSLNDILMQGPDLANNLLGVLFRFRKGSCAFTADIEKMFYAVKVSSKHTDFLRLLWYDEKNKLCEYKLTVHLFGAISSPSVANFALQQTARDDETHSIEVRKTILRDFYVDDLCKSTKNHEKAVDLALNVKEVVSYGGFNLTSFSSNSRVLLAALPKDDLSTKLKKIRLDDCLPCDRTLGVSWNPEVDTLSYSVNFTVLENPTRREILKIMASIYDPMGLVAPVLIKAKQIFQETCKIKLGWDDKLPLSLSETWNTWMKSIFDLNDYEIPRCLEPYEEYSVIELHTFCDGSQVAYGAVTYLKFCGGNTKTSLLFAKARVTPLNNSTLKTIPRIELCAAKLAVESANKVRRELDLAIHRQYFWSDSLTVLKYIRNVKSRFRRFVSNKISFILNYSSSEDWHYVQSEINPADILSRGTDVRTLNSSSLWRNGPAFLLNEESFPEQERVPDLEESDEELLPATKTLIAVVQSENPTDILLNSSADWFRIKLRVAWFLRLRGSLLEKRKLVSGNITVEELKTAEMAIMRYLQQKSYPEVIKIITGNRPLPKNNPLHKLNPFLCENGYLRVGGRLCNSNLTFEFRHPLILPGNNPVIESLVYEIHRQVGHMGRAAILSELRLKYWVVKGNALARKICRSCFFCRKTQAKPGQQMMADLPQVRVTGDTPAFANVGIDYFGPFEVKHLRKFEKKYGVIFTCLSSRALHLEIAESLSTDSFINALRRFVCRRGAVRTLVSDNGTNFVGACRELRKEIDKWNNQTIVKWLQQKNIAWKFNPPAASNFGGVWERLIRSVRKVFRSLFLQRNVSLSHEELCTLMCEVESILNSRPLTEVSNDANDIEVLTPNHLLLFNSEVTFPPGIFSDKDLYPARRWKQVQYLASLFWSRWKKEYLSLLQERQKWTTKTRSFKIGDLVLVVDQQAPRNLWPLARIVNVYPDKYDNVRFVDVALAKNRELGKIKFGTVVIKRPITKLVLLRSVEDLY